MLTDRGFTCQDHVGIAMAEVKTPPFTRGKQQLEKVEINWSRELSLLTIRVERLIRTLKTKILILQNVIPISLVAEQTHH